MKTTSIDLTDIPLLELQTEFQVNDHFIDLHNEYDLIKINRVTDEITFIFRHLELSHIHVYLHFHKIISCDFQIDFSEGFFDFDNFHRGRIEQDGKLYDYIGNDKCYYLSCLGEMEFTIRCLQVELVLEGDLPIKRQMEQIK